MSNLCLTTLTVFHPDREKMKLFADGIKNNCLLSTFILSEDQPNTKWDVLWGEFELSGDGYVGHGKFCTCYYPPISAFEEFQRMGFNIIAEYDCVEDDYLGSWANGHHNHYSYGGCEEQYENSLAHLENTEDPLEGEIVTLTAEDVERWKREEMENLSGIDTGDHHH